MSTPSLGVPSISPTSDFNDVVDSYYQWVKARILAINSDRDFKGIIQARDWPFKQAALNAYYLAIASETPGTLGYSRRSGIPNVSPQTPVYVTRLSWVYLIQGTDIQPGQQVPNRSKYRANNAIKQELIHGNFPQFCERLQWSIDASNVLNSASYFPKESIWWSQITFKDKIDSTGILFGEGSLLVTSFAPTILE